METMKAFAYQFGRNFRIENANGENIGITDFSSKGNPSKGVPAGGLPSFFINFNSPTAGNDVAQAIQDRFGVNMTLVVPKDGQKKFKPFKRMKVALRFDKFPPSVTLYSGQNAVVLSEAPEYVDGSPVPLSLAEQQERLENLKILDDIVIDRIDVEINVSKNGKTYTHDLKVWQMLDSDGEPLSKSSENREFLLSESDHDDEEDY